MRLGAQECRLLPGTLAQRLYRSSLITERHRHRDCTIELHDR